MEHALAYYIKRCIVYDQSDRQTGTAILDPVISPKLRVAGGWSMPLLITQRYVLCMISQTDRRALLF